VPLFKDHIAQANSNLVFLENVNQKIASCHDWQVTICFYTAVHLVNAHLANYGLQYRSHEQVKNALNPETQLSATKIEEEAYISFVKLQHLSRRSRYLVKDGDNPPATSETFFTYDKHFAKAIKHLDNLIIYFKSKLNIDCNSPTINCIGLNKSTLQHFK